MAHLNKSTFTPAASPVDILGIGETLPFLSDSANTSPRHLRHFVSSANFEKFSVRPDIFTNLLIPWTQKLWFTWNSTLNLVQQCIEVTVISLRLCVQTALAYSGFLFEFIPVIFRIVGSAYCYPITLDPPPFERAVFSEAAELVLLSATRKPLKAQQQRRILSA
ncbi:hypothetical protein K438DRAFT_1779624 [Mycena galopus ATCC 62051]|nr:hypothetical protein K438DRAFT_1779624 [Mycena galopus ATCC 62051]